MRKALLFFITITIMGSAFMDNKLYAQDPEFSQFYANPLYLNPAFAGSARCPRICMNFRDEWPAIPGTFVTYSASYDQHVDGLNGGVGLLLSQDQAGLATLTTTCASLIYAYQLTVSRTFSISAGFQATYMEKSLDEGKLNFGDMIDPRRGFVLATSEQITRSSIATPDFSAGLLGYSKNLFFGFAADHLTQPDESFVGVGSPLPMRLTAHAGAMIPLSNHYSQDDQVTISPDVLFVKQQDFTQLNLGFYLMKGPIVGGLWYRNQDAIIALIGFQKKSIRMGYSYDITVSKLTEATAGAQEISLMFIFSCRPKIRHYRTISCPSF
ncbi:MAG: type IX secretion system membrane protein PorP/SprF [Bacteroidia bacterium]|nr:type IX secretion system membrane protein PorP/SprF [Bacteroidia bacterium]